MLIEKYMLIIHLWYSENYIPYCLQKTQKRTAGKQSVFAKSENIL